MFDWVLNAIVGYKKKLILKDSSVIIVRVGDCTFSKLVYAPLKSDPHLPKAFIICFIKSPLKMMKTAFYFILKALFLLKILNFLS